MSSTFVLTEQQKLAGSVIQALFGPMPLTETVAGETETYLLLENLNFKIYIYNDGEMNIFTPERKLMFELPDYESSIALLDAAIVALREIGVAD